MEDVILAQMVQLEESNNYYFLLLNSNSLIIPYTTLFMVQQ